MTPMTQDEIAAAILLLDGLPEGAGVRVSFAWASSEPPRVRVGRIEAVVRAPVPGLSFREGKTVHTITPEQIVYSMEVLTEREALIYALLAGRPADAQVTILDPTGKDVTPAPAPDEDSAWLEHIAGASATRCLCALNRMIFLNHPAHAEPFLRHYSGRPAAVYDLETGGVSQMGTIGPGRLARWRQRLLAGLSRLTGRPGRESPKPSAESE